MKILKTVGSYTKEPFTKESVHTAKVWQDHIAMGNAFARVFRSSVQSLGKLHPLPEAIWKAAMATYFYAAVRIPLTCYFLVEDLRDITKQKIGSQAIKPFSKATNRVGALAAQCLQFTKGLKAFTRINPMIPMIAVQVLGAVGIIFAGLGIRSHILAGLESWKAASYSKTHEFKAIAHALSASSITLNSVAVVLIYFTGLAVSAYMIIGVSALLSTVKYGFIKPRMGELRYL